jgi:hypothetical protein
MCGYEPTKEQEIDPSSPTENCPQCGGMNSVVDEESEAAQEEGEEE